jgi:heme-degrading monooxygenase HmoA
MILETAIFTIHAGQEEQFLEAFSRGRKFIEQSKGCHRLELRRGIEEPETFVLVVWWQTLEDHTVSFKQSSNFTDWRAVVGHFFARPPVVNHYLEEA